MGHIYIEGSIGIFLTFMRRIYPVIWDIGICSMEY